MNSSPLLKAEPSQNNPVDLNHYALAPRPRTVAETGLSWNLLAELLAKHLYDGGVAELRDLVARTALAGPVLEEILDYLRRDACIEVRGSMDRTSTALRYALTERGRAFAIEAIQRSGYLGPTPITIEHYEQVVRAQSVHLHDVTQAEMQAAFADVVVQTSLLDQLGPALHSGRAIFIYGPPGTGKTYIGQRLARLLGAPVLIPHAFAIGDAVIQVFDPVIHKPVNEKNDTPSMMLQEGFDPRFILCQRPAVLTGGELTLDMLEISYESNTKTYQAPLQLKANNGIYLIDDLGRQRIAPVDLFNRWIVPLEGRQDYLSLAMGKRFPVPFDVVLIFSTNLNPQDLADEAFLRRLGHKIRFGHLQPEQYAAIWSQVCEQRGIPFNPELLNFALDQLHAKSGIPLLPCHPRDILGIALDQARYSGSGSHITIAMLESAWKNYFVSLDSYSG